LTEIIASGLVWAGTAFALFGAVNLARPLRWLRVRRRRAGALFLAGGFLLVIAGFGLPTREYAATRATSRLDVLVPAWQFSERHTTRIHAKTDDVYRATKQVTAAEIRLFRTLTWIRHPRPPWDRGAESMLAPPAGQPILAVALQSGFVSLADESNRELVVGAVVCCRPADAKRLLPRLRALGAAGFEALDDPGVAKAGMNFLLQDEGNGWTRLTTETRVYATDATARRLFSRYWRVIYPGSALIRRMWLRAIKKRAEAGAGAAG
jgi:hypothetical protein